jgi:hypothetical protein
MQLDILLVAMSEIICTMFSLKSHNWVFNIFGGVLSCGKFYIQNSKMKTIIRMAHTSSNKNNTLSVSITAINHLKMGTVPTPKKYKSNIPQTKDYVKHNTGICVTHKTTVIRTI